MKPTALLTLAAGLLFHVAHGQTAQPKKGDNVILIQTPDSAGVALRKLGQVFVAQGYTVEKLDKQFNTLTLAPKSLPTNFSPTFSARATATPEVGSILKIAGDYRASLGVHQVNGVAQFTGSDGGTDKKTFKELQRAALAYPGGQVSYSKQ